MKVFLFVLALAGCYNPSLSNPGFYCHPEDVPACPDGQMCINGRCSAQNITVDGGVGGGGGGDDMMTVQQPDLASKPADMAKPVDLAQSSPDLSGGSCGMPGSPCATDGDCCTGSLCLPGFNFCF